MSHPVAELAFWMALGGLFYTYPGYPLLLRLRCACKPAERPASTTETGLPRVTVVLAVHNEAERIAARLDNLLASDYPGGHLDIVVVSDASTDNTVKTIRDRADARVRCVELSERGGKAAALNAGVAAATGDVIVFADARQTFAPQTIRRLAAAFVDPKLGAVSGELTIAASGSAVGEGVGAYWKLEKFIRRSESQLGSVIGCTGAVYAIRRKLYQPIPSDTILDDVVIPMTILTQGYRVAFNAEAAAFDPQSLEPQSENIRKRRTLAGNFQMLFRYPQWLFPWKNPEWLALVSHKYLRLLGPFLMALVFAVNFCLLDSPPYQLLFAAQVLFYLLALLGILLPRVRLPLLTLPAGFCFLNGLVLSGLGYYLGSDSAKGWQKPTAKSG